VTTGGMAPRRNFPTGAINPTRGHAQLVSEIR
jgi:hypothetical protein